jgi:hypothetical protein
MRLCTGGAAFGSPLFRRRGSPKPKPQPGGKSGGALALQHEDRFLSRGTEHQHQHSFWAGSSSARVFTAADFVVGISAGPPPDRRGMSRFAAAFEDILGGFIASGVASSASSPLSARLMPLLLAPLGLVSFREPTETSARGPIGAVPRHFERLFSLTDGLQNEVKQFAR